MITAGSTELLRDESVIFAEKLQRYGVETWFKNLMKKMPHCGYPSEDPELQKVCDVYGKDRADFMRKMFAQKSKL
eukprot:TRINITY_DN8486_c0_g1_i1.p2 TRINITY_DN8486_c0_g1~~TRINITY_DN8486_c0_g1_i1.p2  ORF type:complete len:75 (+),score=15.10 TRINITY_DN8486_c0_g1_i1:58-282(+)